MNPHFHGYKKGEGPIPEGAVQDREPLDNIEAGVTPKIHWANGHPHATRSRGRVLR